MFCNTPALQALAYALTNLDHADSRLAKMGDPSGMQSSINALRSHVGAALHAMLPALRDEVAAKRAGNPDAFGTAARNTAIELAGWRWSTRLQGMVHDRMRDADNRHMAFTREDAIDMT